MPVAALGFAHFKVLFLRVIRYCREMTLFSWRRACCRALAQSNICYRSFGACAMSQHAAHDAPDEARRFLPAAHGRLAPKSEKTYQQIFGNIIALDAFSKTRHGHSRAPIALPPSGSISQARLRQASISLADMNRDDRKYSRILLPHGHRRARDYT